MENQNASQERQQKQDTADTKPIHSAGIPSWSFPRVKTTRKGCMRCLDSGGTHLWPLSLKQPHASLTARTCYCAGKDYGLAKGSFLISVFCGNEKLWFTTYQHHNIHLNHDIHAAILPSCMYHARKTLRQLIHLKRYKPLWLQVYPVSPVLVIYYSL